MSYETVWKLLSKYRRVVRSLVIALCTLSGAIGYADFRAEITGTYADAGDDLFFDAAGAELLDFSASVFLRPVNDSKGPYALAQFLSRASRLTYNYTAAEAFDATTDTHTLSLRYIDVSSGWIGGATVSVLDLPEAAFAPDLDVDLDSNGYLVGLNLGKYIAENTTIELAGSFDRQELDQTVSQDCPQGLEALGCLALVSDSDSTIDAWTVSTSLQHVTQLGGRALALSAGASFATSDCDSNASIDFVFDGDVPPGFESMEFDFNDSLGDVWEGFVAGTWFLNRSLGVGLDYRFNRLAGVSLHSIGADVGWFITPFIELQGGYEVGFVANSSADTDAWRLTLRGRF